MSVPIEYEYENEEIQMGLIFPNPIVDHVVE